MEAWKAGDLGVLREVHLGRLWSARPGYVVSDEGERASFYFPWNTECHWPFHGDQDLRIPSDEWHLRTGSWLPFEQLHLMEVGAIHHVSVFWTPDTFEPAGWKVDFHAPAQRTRFGFDALDWALDLMIAPDRSHRLKDEDEFAAYQELGLLTSEQVAAVRTQLEQVLEQVRAQSGPFSDRLLEWRPDPKWSAASSGPPLPPGWDRV